MKQIHILIIDDQYARDDLLRMDLLIKTGIVEMIIGQHVFGDIGAYFCSGQQVEGNKLQNDYGIIVQAIKQRWRDDADFKWDLVLLDVQFDSGELVNGKPKGQRDDETFGVNVREWLRRDFPDLPVVMLSGKHKAEIKGSQEYYLSKEGINERYLKVVLLKYGQLSLGQARHLLELGQNIIFASDEMFKVYRNAYEYAAYNDPVLILGETGSGKEELAKYIHKMSPRKDNSFVAVNVSAIPENLAESEMFGHEKGAFTGAGNVRKGRFELAHKGTLFLDEIGDMPLLLQSKVLRTIQEGVVQRLSSHTDLAVNVRLISATHRNLEEQIAANTFREDLFYRINGTTITIPPLRDRRADIKPLAEALLKEAMRDKNKIGIIFSKDAMDKLVEYDFPGNVRELKNIIERLVAVTGNNDVISEKDIMLLTIFSGTACTVGQGGAPSAVQLPVTTAQDSVKIAAPTSMQPSALSNVTLANLHEVIAAIDIKPDDPALLGIKPRVEIVIQDLMQRCVGAALECCKKPMGKYELQPAMQLLANDKTMKGTRPNRELEKILNRQQKRATVQQDELVALVESWKSSKNKE